MVRLIPFPWREGEWPPEVPTVEILRLRGRGGEAITAGCGERSMRPERCIGSGGRGTVSMGWCCGSASIKDLYPTVPTGHEDQAGEERVRVPSSRPTAPRVTADAGPR